MEPRAEIETKVHMMQELIEFGTTEIDITKVRLVEPRAESETKPVLQWSQGLI